MSPDETPADVLYEDAGEKDGYTSSDILAGSIVGGIYEGTYVPGQRLVELDLINDYRASRSTLREAIKQLKADGIIATNPYQGAQIRKLMREDAMNILAVTEVIIGLAARQAVEHIEDPGAREKLQAALDELVESANADSQFEFVRRRNHFDSTLIRISGNTELFRHLQKLQVHLIRNRLVVPRDERIEGYREIAKLVDAGDADGAEARARQYARRTAELLAPLF